MWEILQHALGKIMEAILGLGSLMLCLYFHEKGYFQKFHNYLNSRFFLITHKNFKLKANESYFEDFISYASEYEPNTPTDVKLPLTASIGNFTICYYFGRIYVEYGTFEKTFHDIPQNQIFDEFTYMLFLNQTPTCELQSLELEYIRECAKKRTYAYDYEELIFKIFSKYCYYDRNKGYYLNYNFNGIYGINLINEIEKEYHIETSKAATIFQEWITHQLIDKCDFKTSDIYDTRYTIGKTLTHYWDIVTPKDMCLNKWAYKQKIPRIKFEMPAFPTKSSNQ